MPKRAYRQKQGFKEEDVMSIITRLFRLERDLAGQERFDKVGEQNLVSSIKGEEGTLAMYATHLPEDPATCYVFEVYADDDAYNVHAASPQFKAYVQMAGEILTGREVISLEPQLLVEKSDPLLVTGANEVAPRLALVDVLPERDKDFREAVFANMRASVEQEPGVLVMYAATRADNPNSWAFWEVYASEEAYAAHRDTDHFKAYIDATADCVTSKQLIALAADTLASKGSLRG
jgi:quinol monooxygenase YgiN